MAAVTEVSETLAGLTGLLGQLEDFYLDLHRHPELAFQERRTANLVAQQLRRMGYQVTAGIGQTGVVGELANGDGPTVLLRADMDALPVAERTGLPYLSRETVVDEDGRQVPVMHACGHDMHVAWLLGAAALLARAPRRWAGRLLLVFQPGEESGEGAQRMVEDGLFDRFGRPDVLFGQHVSPAPAARIGMRAGPLMAAMDALCVRLFGRGASGSRPEAAVDPVVLAAATVMRLQTVVSREVGPDERVVLTVGQIHSGTVEVLIPSEAELGLSIRTFEQPVRDRVLRAVERIIQAEAAAAAAPRPPQITRTRSYPQLVNDEAATRRLWAAFAEHFGADEVFESELIAGSEDFGVLSAAAQAPSVFWTVGGSDPQRYAKAKAVGRFAQDIPSIHSPYFAPLRHPTLPVGVRTLVTAAMTWLNPA